MTTNLVEGYQAYIRFSLVHKDSPPNPNPSGYTTTTFP